MEVTKHFMAKDVICHINEIFLLRNLYTACSAAAKEEGLLTVETKQNLFLVKEMIQSCYLTVHHVCFHDWHIADILVFQTGRRQTPGISISWYMQRTRMCAEAVIVKQLTCCKFTSYSSHPAVSYSSTQTKMPSLAIRPQNRAS